MASTDGIKSILPADNSPNDAHLLSRPALSYIALIAKVILSSPSQKLNLASIYRAMEENFSYLRSRGPGWKNSVRHNLSVNDCFVKVSRCEDGRGHYWGIHRAHLRDFQQGNFRLHRKARGRRERCDRSERCLIWMGTYLGRISAWVEPQCPLQEPGRHQLCYWDWIQMQYQPLSVITGWVQSPRLKLPDSNSTTTAVRGHDTQPMRPLHCSEMTDPLLTGLKESYDGRFTTKPTQAVLLPDHWCL